MNSKNIVLLAIFAFVGSFTPFSLAMEQKKQGKKTGSMKPSEFFGMFKEQKAVIHQVSNNQQQVVPKESVVVRKRPNGTDQFYYFEAEKLLLPSTHIKVVKYLISTGVDVNKNLSSNNWTALFCALAEKDTEFIKLLVDMGPDVHTRDICGNTVLHYAAIGSTPEIVRYLLENGFKAVINAKDGMEQSPLYAACRDGKYENAKILLEYGADVNIKGVRLFIPDPNRVPISVYHDPNAIKPEVEHFIVGTFINPRADEGWTPLHIASHNGHSKIVDLLIKNRADVDAKDYRHITPMHAASWNGHDLVVEQLCNAGANVDAETIETDDFVPEEMNHVSGKITPLFGAILCGKTKVVEILASKANVNHTVGSFQVTPLHQASLLGNFDIVKILVKNGAHFMSLIWGRHTAADVARCYGKNDVAEFLAEKVNFFKEMARGKTNNSQKSIEIIKNNGALKKAINIQPMGNIRGNLPLINSTIREQKAEFSFEVAYCAPEKNEFIGMYYCGQNGERKPVLANTKSKDGLCIVNNHLFNLNYVGCKKINMHNDVCHSFSKDIEKNFGHQSRVIIDIQDVEQIRDSKKKHDLYITMPGRMNQKKYENDKWSVVGSKPGVFEFIVEKSLYENKGVCCHRLFRPGKLIGDKGFGPEFRKKEQKKLNNGLITNKS